MPRVKSHRCVGKCCLITAVAQDAGHFTIKDVPEETVTVAKNFKLLDSAAIGTAPPSDPQIAQIAVGPVHLP